jgi:hypothetical protein
VIIRRSESSLLFITQTDHAVLAAEIMTHWRAQALTENPRRERILFALCEHDNGWTEEDRDTHVDGRGTPLDFVSVPADVKHRIWPRAVARLGRDRRYEAALIAQHALTVHAGQRGDSAWLPFFDTMERARGSCMGGVQPPMSRGRFLADYRFVRIGDLLSLVFCNGWLEPHDLPDGRRTILKGTTIVVIPDPFGGARVAFRIRARRIPAHRYASAAELRAALDAAPFESLKGEAVGSSF